MGEILNRKLPPPINNWNEPLHLFVEEVKLDNGVIIHLVETGTQELMKIQGLFPGGVRYQNKPFVAKFTNALFAEGSKKYSAKEIAEAVDRYGAYFNNSTGMDTGNISFYILNKHFPKMMPIVEDVIKNPVFPAEEVEIYKNNSIQDFLVKQEKVDFLAKRWFHRQLYGENHPYGKIGKITDFENIRVEDLVDFHKQNYSLSACKIIAVGKIPKNFVHLFNRYFGQEPVNAFKEAAPLSMQELPSPKKEFVSKEKALQSAIYVGKVLFNRKHPDYFDFNIMNTILGGYFGSRLMKNIREDKAYTYGIGSRLTSHHSAGTFSISAQVGSKFTRLALQEIYREIEIMQHDLVPDEELTTVRNYLSGQVLQSMDGLFSIASLTRNLIEYGLDISYMENYLRHIHSITPERIREVARQYLSLDSLHELVVG